MTDSVLTIAQNACTREGLTNTISSLITPTSNFEKQVCECMQTAGQSLAEACVWPALIKTCLVTLSPSRDYYELPDDFLSPIADTFWNTSGQWPVEGPMSPQEWNVRKFGWVSSAPFGRYRIVGSSTSGTFIVDPMPDSTNDGEMIAFQYVSGSWVRPAAARTGGSSFTQLDYVFINEVNRQCAKWADDSATWAYGSATTITSSDATSTDYTAGDMFRFTQTIVKTFQIVTVASGGGVTTLTLHPNSASTSIANAAITSPQLAVAEVTLPPETIIAITYQTAISGTKSPCLNNGYYDGSITWYPVMYNRFKADTDVPVVDEDLLSQGMIWRLFRAQGKPYEDKRAEYDADVARRFAMSKATTALYMADAGDGMHFIDYCNIKDTGHGL